MNGSDLLDEISRRIMKRKGSKSITDAALARELGVTQPALNNYRKPKITPRQAANLMEKYANLCENRLKTESIVPIVEFFYLDPIETKHGKSWKLFSAVGNDGKSHPFLKGLQDRLTNSRGIYVFHDSRGRAIYAGKAQRLSLWAEMNSAFNRNRGEVQNIKRVNHPTRRIVYKTPEEKKRRIIREDVALHDLASYVSAYQVSEGLIGKLEAFIVRSFANDLLNVRMESF